MNRLENITKPMMWSTILLLAAIVAGCGGGGDGVLGANPGSGQTGGVCNGSKCVNLGTAGNYAILAETGISTTGTTAVTGNLGLSPYAASFFTGFGQTLDASNIFSTSSLVTGKLYASDYAPPTPANLTTAVSNMETAYTNAGLMAPAGGGLTTACPGTGAMSDGSGGGSGGPIAAGVYTCAVNVTIPGNLTLHGSSTDVWVFRITGTLDQSSATKVLLTGGALAKNVFWVVSGVVTIGASAGGVTTQMQGVILAKTNIAVQTGATVNGRLLAQTRVDLDANAVTVP
jgi:hypothetical protein